MNCSPVTTLADPVKQEGAIVCPMCRHKHPISDRTADETGMLFIQCGGCGITLRSQIDKIIMVETDVFKKADGIIRK